MLKISIVPDTNVLMDSLDIVQGLYSSPINSSFTINYAKMVLTELDKLKFKINARKAIKFIDTVSEEFKTEIEGKFDDRKMEVAVAHVQPIIETNNDDKILNYCLTLENPILMTNDVALILKCQANNLACLKIANKTLKMIVGEINHLLGFGSSEEIKSKDKCLAELKNSIKILIQPHMIYILYQKLGENYYMVFNINSNLEYYVEFIGKQFFLFTDYLPNKSRKFIFNFLHILKSKNIDEIKNQAKILCLMFRISPNCLM